MSGAAADRDGATRGRDRRRVRWPVLATAVLLLVLLALTTTLERIAPRVDGVAPAVEQLPPPLLDAPVRCSRADDAERLDRLRATLDPDGRLTAAIATACPRLLDGREVLYIGEVVGDVLRREGGAWAQINDDPYALEVGPFGPHRRCTRPAREPRRDRPCRGDPAARRPRGRWWPQRARRAAEDPHAGRPRRRTAEPSARRQRSDRRAPVLARLGLGATHGAFPGALSEPSGPADQRRSCRPATADDGQSGSIGHASQRRARASQAPRP